MDSKRYNIIYNDIVLNVIQHATTLITVNGIKQFHIHDLIKITHISKSTLYKIFGNQMEIIKLTILNSLQQMKIFIEENIENNLEFESFISQIIELRNSYLTSNNFMSTIIEEFKTNSNPSTNQIVSLFEREEDSILTNMLCKYYHTNENAITSLGYDFNQIWSCVFTFDIRNKLADYMHSLKDSVNKICYGNN